jgi:hypothetical protein
MTVFDFVERFILFVIPGFIAYSMFCYLTGKKPLSDLISAFYVFIASIFSFIVGNFLLQLVNFFPYIEFQLVEVTQILSWNNGSLSVAGIISASIAAIILTFIAVFVWDQNLLFRFANFFNLSHRADNSPVWDYMFDRQPWIVVRDYVTGNTYYGKVIKYSDGTETRELLLEEVSVWSKADGEYKMEEVYLSRLPSEFSIEIDNYIKGDNGKLVEEK